MSKVNVYFNPEGREILVEGTSYTPTSEVAQLRERVKQLEALGSHAANEMIKNAESKNALAAQVEQLREVINHYQEGQVPSDNAMDELIHRANKTPVQCLAEVQAQAGRKGYLAGFELARDFYKQFNKLENSPDKYADYYAYQIRQAAKAGAEEKHYSGVEVSELKVQVQTIKHIALELSGVISEYEQMQEKSLRARMFDTNHRYMNRIAQTPAQCLSEVKAQASKEGYVAALITHTEEPTAWCNEQASKHYDQLRQQVKVN